jgi:hypothetical protein
MLEPQGAQEETPQGSAWVCWDTVDELSLQILNVSKCSGQQEKGVAITAVGTFPPKHWSPCAVNCHLPAPLMLPKAS